MKLGSNWWCSHLFRSILLIMIGKGKGGEERIQEGERGEERDRVDWGFWGEYFVYF